MIPLALALVLVGCAPRGEDHACTDVTFFADADGDGHGDPSATIAACAAPDGYITESDDCDDGNAEVQQGTVWYVDADADGFGDPATGAPACESPRDRIAVGEDCDDTNIAIHPDAEELCNTTDDDCDGAIDEEPIDGTTFYGDADGDGVGDASVDVVACAQPSGYVAEATDCDDGDASVGAAQTYYYDHDADGYGDGEASSTCTPAANQVLLDGDCRPLNPDFSPGTAEVCNSEDDNCDGLVDEDDPLLVGTTYYADDDRDGFGDPTDAHVWCEPTDGYTLISSDCDDTNFAIRPGAREYCDGIDNDCDGSVDDSPVYVDWYADDDGDGYGDPDDTVSDCGLLLTGYVLSQGDCDDTDATVHPGSSEVCANDADDDCDGASDNCVLGYEDLFDFVAGEWEDMGKRMAVADANGDDAADLLVSEPIHDWTGYAFIAVGLATGSTSLSDLLELHGTTDDSLFGTGLGGGDVNLDEVDDILVGAPGSGTAYLFLGPVTADREDTDADTIFGFGADSAGSDVDAVDFDADGSPDVAVGACCDSLYVGAVYVASGPVSAVVDLVHDATWRFDGPSADDRVGNQVVDAGDMNGDGIHDLAIGAESGNGTVYVVDGGMAEGMYSIDLVASVAIEGPEPDSYFGSGLVTADYDGDGTIDVVAGAYEANSSQGGVYAFLGPLSGALDVSDADATWLGDGPDVGWLGRAVAAGDIDGDGSTDLALGAPDGSPTAAYFQLGLVSGTVEVWTLPSFVGAGGYGDLGYSIVLVPDWTGDGGAEVAIGVPGFTAWEGYVDGFAVLLSEELY